MKKIFIGAALALAAIAASAQTTLVAEYDFNHTAGKGIDAHYSAFGVVQATKYGTFDGYWQGNHVIYDGKPKTKDNLNGWEFGYGNAYSLSQRNTLLGRIALGNFSNINVGTGKDIRANYVLISGEVNRRVNDRLSAYVGLSHMNGLSKDAISASNRLQFGVDYVLTANTSLRVGGSVIRQLGTTLNGGVVLLSYTL